MHSYFTTFQKEDLLNNWMGLLIEEIMNDRSIDTTKMTEEEKNILGSELTKEWSEDKTFIKQCDILFEKFATEEEKSDYKTWKISENL